MPFHIRRIFANSGPITGVTDVREDADLLREKADVRIASGFSMRACQRSLRKHVPEPADQNAEQDVRLFDRDSRRPQALARPVVRLGQAARRDVADKHSLDANIAAHEALYGEIAADILQG